MMKVINPDRSIHQYHSVIDFLLGILFSFFSLPPKAASRFALSCAIKASKPRLTRVVFSDIPVSREAFLRI